MSASRKSFILLKRYSKKHGQIFYVSLLREDGTRPAPRSSHTTTKTAPTNWALNELSAGRVDVPKNRTFEAFAGDFWDIESDYVQRRLIEGRIGPSYLDISKGWTDRYLIPYFGRFRLRDIHADDIDRFKVKLTKTTSETTGRTLSPKTVNHVLRCLRVILNEAVRQRLIPHSPFEGVSLLREKPRDFGILTMEEAAELFNDDRLYEYWPGDHRLRTLNYLAAVAGMGELQALTYEKIKSDTIEVSSSWERRYGLKGTKNGRPRLVPIDRKAKVYLARVLAELLKKEPGAFLFTMESDRTRPVLATTISYTFYRALVALGAARKRRGLEGIGRIRKAQNQIFKFVG